jgi:ABC-type lipoprotein export system ATPase subunit
LHREQRVTLIMVTHDSGIARLAERVLEVRDGCIVGDHRNSTTPPP